jgi:hypothetical protein
MFRDGRAIFQGAESISICKRHEIGDEAFGKRRSLIPPKVIIALSINIVVLIFGYYVMMILVPWRSDYDGLISSQSRMGRSLGATRTWMLRATPG